MKDFFGQDLDPGAWVVYWALGRGCGGFSFARVFLVTDSGVVCRYIHTGNPFRQRLFRAPHRRMIRIPRTRVPDDIAERLEAVS